MSLTEELEQSHQRRLERMRDRYHYARSLGFPSASAMKMQSWGIAKIQEAARERKEQERNKPPEPKPEPKPSEPPPPPEPPKEAEPSKPPPPPKPSGPTYHKPPRDGSVHRKISDVIKP